MCQIAHCRSCWGSMDTAGSKSGRLQGGLEANLAPFRSCGSCRGSVTPPAASELRFAREVMDPDCAKT
jgi:hypothetical protein